MSFQLSIEKGGGVYTPTPLWTGTSNISKTALNFETLAILTKNSYKHFGTPKFECEPLINLLNKFYMEKISPFLEIA